MEYILPALSLLVALLGTIALRHYALVREIMDIPNDRSSHTVPTPRGGGVAIVLVFLAALTVWQAIQGVEPNLFMALVPGGALIALLGFWDDHSSLPAKVRLVFHLAASAWAVFWLEGWPVLDLGFGSLSWGWLGAGVAVLALTWAINLYNFMDGIDGLAGMEAVFVAGSGAALLWLRGADAMPLILLAAASGGFLLLNWPPAKIFMGDAGSGFLGYALGVLALHATTRGITTIWPWLILLGVFLVDATVTLLHRASLRQRVMSAHRSHAYQWASRRLGAHQPVTLTILAINLFVLLPGAFAVLAWPTLTLPISTAVLGSLAGLAWQQGAGRPETL